MGHFPIRSWSNDLGIQSSEKRIRELIAKQEAQHDSPLQEKAVNTTDFRYANPSFPQPSFSSFAATSVHSQDVRKDTHKQHSASTRPGYVINLPGSNETRFADYHDASAGPTSPPPPSIRSGYKVPNNTPAHVPDSAQTHTQRSAPQYVVQLPAPYLRTRPPRPNDQCQPTTSSLQGPFHVPSPSIFKAAPPSRALEIRRPPSSEKASSEGVIPPGPTNTSEGVINEEVAMSPVSSAGTATPATMGGPFTPYTNPAEFPLAEDEEQQQNEKGRHVDENGRGMRSESIVHFNEDF